MKTISMSHPFTAPLIRSRNATLALRLLAAAGLLLIQSATLTAADRPNILFIVGDDMGYGDVGFHQCKDIPTPNLDALAASGVRFTSGYVTGPYCSPTRAGLLTGRYQTRFGHEFNPAGTHGIPLTERTIADRLKPAGYATALVGKWHLGAPEEMQPQKRGFDEFFGFLGGAHSYIKTAGILRGKEPVTELNYTTDAFGREAVSFIKKHSQTGPWFLYLAFNAVHTPMDATSERLARFAGIADKRRRTYAAMMLAMDEAIGLVRKTLVETGAEKNTLVFFFSDNGGPTMPGVTVNGSHNGPLRGSKRTTLEGGVRVPFVISWPGRVKPGVYHKPAIQLDITATALTAAGLDVKSDPKMEGVDLLPFLDGKNAGEPHEALYWRFGQQMAVRMGDFKLVRYDSNADTLTGGRRQPVTASKLYNLAIDIGETNDLAMSMPEKVKTLQRKWDDWNKANVPPLWGNQAGDSDGAEPGAAAPAKKKRQANP
jgi:arylsulfatase A-like enzyme